MKSNVIRGILAAVLLIPVTAGLMVAFSPETPAASDRCEQRCYRDYRRCVPICSKNPCFVACETVLEICLSNCGS